VEPSRDVGLHRVVSPIDDDLLQSIRSRAAGYDRDNAFFTEDLDELKAAGYLRPRPLLEAVRDQRLLAAHAPATALGVNMHLVWTTVALVLHDRGDDSLDWLLEEAASGEVFAFGISEPGNDQVLWDSRTTAEPVGDGGYAFTGTKGFTSMTPAWTRLGVFGRDGDELVHGFLTRESPGWRALDDWDTLGMRATQSRTTVLEGAVVPAERIVRRLPVGPNADPFVFAVFSGFLLLIASVYAGIADRALELAVDGARRKTTLAGDPLSDDPDVRRRLAAAALQIDALAPQIESLARDVDEIADHGARWFRLLTGTKHRSVETARQVVDAAMRGAGGSGYSAASELSRLQRDVLAGIYHPSSTDSVHATVATDLFR